MRTRLLGELEQITALVVGASQGIGLGFVRSLLADERCSQVFATYRSRNKLQDLRDLQEEHPNRLSLLPMDVTEETQIASSIQEIKRTVGELQLALYCAGVLHQGEMFPEKSLRHVTPEHMLYSFQVNSIGAVLVAKHLAPLFKRNSPSIFAALSAKVGSIGDNRLGGWYGYRASKAALNMFVKTTAIEFARRCPRTIVVALHPGTTDTRLSQPFQANVPEEQLFSVERTVTQLTQVLARLELKDSGEFYSWNGKRLPW